MLSNWFRFEALSTVIISSVAAKFLGPRGLFLGLSYCALVSLARPSFLYCNESIMGSLVAVTIFGLRGRLLYAASLGVSAMAIWAGSWGLGVGIAGGVLGLVLHKWWGKVLGGIAFLSGIFILSVRPEISTGRTALWGMLYDYFRVTPDFWLGTGIGSFFAKTVEIQEQYGITQGNLFLHAHNDFLELLFELGGVGMAFLLAGLGALLWKSRGQSRAMLTALVATSLVNWTLYSPVGALLFFYIMQQILKEEI